MAVYKDKNGTWYVSARYTGYFQSHSENDPGQRIQPKILQPIVCPYQTQEIRRRQATDAAFTAK